MKKKFLISFTLIISLLIIFFSSNVYAKKEENGFLIEGTKTEGFVYDNNYEYKKIKPERIEIDNSKIKVEDNNNEFENKVLPENNNGEFIYSKIEGNIENVYVSADKKNDYYINNVLFSNGGSYYEIIRHDIKANTNTVIYKSKTEYFANQKYVKDNIIYIEQADYSKYRENNCNEVQILAFNIKTDKVIFESKNLSIKLDNEDYFHTFVVDSKERFYIVYEYTGIKVFDKNANLIYDNKPVKNADTDTKKYELVLHSIAPNDDGIIYSRGYYSHLPYAYLQTLNQGYQKLKSDGSFVYTNYTLYAGGSYVTDPDWKFIDSTHAVNQYGEIGKFEYYEPTEGKYTGCKITILDTVLRGVYDSYYGYLNNPVYFVKDNYLYLYGSNGIIFVFDINNNYSRVGKITTNINVDEYYYDEVYRMTYIDNYIYIHYYDSSVSTYENRDIEKKISINSLENFKNIWITEHITQNHTKAQIIAKYKEALPKFDYSKTMYDVNPSYKAPYAAGKLKEGVVTDTLNQINYYRWLYGINEITINKNKMERSQKGAVIQAATNTLTHFPKKPDDMDEDFYKEAYAGCNAGAAEGDYYSGNCAQGDSTPGNAIGGFISDIYNVSEGSYVGHRLSLLGLTADRTSFGYCNRFTALSMYEREDGIYPNDEKFYSYPSAGNFPMQNFYTNEYWSLKFMQNYVIKNMKVEFTYNNKVYPAKDISLESGEGTIVFKLPDELVNALGKTGTMPKCTINVKVTDLKDEYGDTTNFSYTVNFFDINEAIIPITGISFENKEQTSNEGLSLKAQDLKINPSNTNESYKIIWSSSKEDVATIDSNGNIECKKQGTTVITATVGTFTASYTLTVKEALPYTLGDVNRDGKVNSLDATLILKYVAKKKVLSANALKAADVNHDNKVNALDAVRILKYVAKKITSF